LETKRKSSIIVMALRILCWQDFQPRRKGIIGKAW